MNSMKITVYSTITKCFSLAIAGWYGWLFRSDILNNQPGIPNVRDYMVEGIRVYIIINFALLLGAAAYSFHHKKEKNVFYIRWAVLDIVIAIIGIIAIIDIVPAIISLMILLCIVAYVS